MLLCPNLLRKSNAIRETRKNILCGIHRGQLATEMSKAPTLMSQYEGKESINSQRAAMVNEDPSP